MANTILFLVCVTKLNADNRNANMVANGAVHYALQLRVIVQCMHT